MTSLYLELTSCVVSRPSPGVAFSHPRLPPGLDGWHGFLRPTQNITNQEGRDEN